MMMAIQCILALGVTVGMTAIWGMYGLIASTTYFAYAVQTQHFPVALTGRAITAMNFFMFVLAFVCQWGIGGVIEAFPAEAGGGYSKAAHSTALWIMIALQAIWFLNFIRPTRKGNVHV